MRDRQQSGKFEFFYFDLFLKIGAYLDPFSLFFWAITSKFFLKFITTSEYNQLWEDQLTNFPLEGLETLKHTNISLINSELTYNVYKTSFLNHYQQLSKIDLLKTHDTNKQSFFSLINKINFKPFHRYVTHQIYQHNTESYILDVLFYAIQQDQADELFKNLLSKCLHALPNKKDINLITINNDTLLNIAIRHNALHTTQLLLDLGANPNPVIDPDQHTLITKHPLCLAIDLKKNTILTILLPKIKKGALCLDVALYLTVKAGDLTLAQGLVNLGAKVNSRLDCPTLYVAMQMGHTHIVNYLLKQGAFSTYKYNGYTPLYVAARNNHLEAIKVFVNFHQKNKLFLNLNEPMDKGDTALYVAAQEGNADVCQFLLENGAENDNCHFCGGFTPLYVAAQNGHFEVVKVICNAKPKPNVNLKSPNNSTILYVAAQNGHSNIVDFLTQQMDCDVNITHQDYTPLYVACQKGNLSIVKTLLSHQASIDLATTKKATPLYVAAQKGYSEIVNILIAHGANVNMTFENGYSPLHAACQSLAYNEAIPIIISLIRAGANPLIRAINGCTAFNVAFDLETETVLEVIEGIASCGLTELVSEESKYTINTSFIHDSLLNLMNDKSDYATNPQIKNFMTLLSNTFTPFGYTVVLYSLLSKEVNPLKITYGLFNASSIIQNPMSDFTQFIINTIGLGGKSATQDCLYSILAATISGNTSGKNLFKKLNEIVIEKIIQIINNPTEVDANLIQEKMLYLNLYEAKIKQQSVQLLEQPSQKRMTLK